MALWRPRPHPPDARHGAATHSGRMEPIPMKEKGKEDNIEVVI
jgi:hypothetical protein